MDDDFDMALYDRTHFSSEAGASHVLVRLMVDQINQARIDDIDSLVGLAWVDEIMD